MTGLPRRIVYFKCAPVASSNRDGMNSFPCVGYVKDTGTPLGRGVFASRSIAAGEIVEICPIVLLEVDFKDLSKALQQRVFNWSNLAKSRAGVHGLALGYGSLYNHANPANLSYEAAADGQQLRFTAVRKIARDEELSINYNGEDGSHISTEDDWFVSRGEVPFER